MHRLIQSLLLFFQLQNPDCQFLRSGMNIDLIRKTGSPARFAMYAI